MKIKIMILMLGISIALTGCGSSGNPKSDVSTADSTQKSQQISNSHSGSTNTKSEPNQSSGTITDKVTTTETTSCQNPPKTLELPKGNYYLKEKNTTLQPGMKFAYMKCENGNFKPGDASDSIVVYSNGNPNDSSDVIVTGNWGNALYSIDGNPSQAGISGDTKIIHLVSPTSNQTVKAGSKITVTGTVAKGFENQTLQVTLFSGTYKESKILQDQKFKVGRDGNFSGTFSVPSSLPSSGTKIAFVLELLVKGGPQIQTTLTAQATGTVPGQTGIIGDTQIIHLVSPTANQTVKAGSKITVTGAVAQGFENQILQVTLFSGTYKESKILQVQKFKVGRDGNFSGTLSVLSSLPSSGTKIAFVLELLVKSGPQIQTTLTAQ